MGIPIELFVSQVGLDDLSCVICLQVLEDPYFVGCKEQHAFCHNCLDDHIQSRVDQRSSRARCPCCRELVSVDKIQPAPFLRRLVEKHHVWCKFECGWQGSMTDKHDEICAQRLVQCFNSECDWIGTMIDSEQHELECGFSPVGCSRKDDCPALVLRKDLAAHDKVCKAYRCVYYSKDGCPFLGDRVSHKAHSSYCEGLHAQMAVIDKEADSEQLSSQEYLRQIGEMERKLSVITELAVAHGVDLSTLAGGFLSSAVPRSGPDTDVDEEAVVASAIEDDGYDEQEDESDAEDSEDDQEDVRSPGSDRSASVIVPGAITVLEQLNRFELPNPQARLDSSPAPAPSPALPTLRPFNLTMLRPPLRLPPLPTVVTTPSSNTRLAQPPAPRPFASVSSAPATFGPAAPSEPRKMAHEVASSPALSTWSGSAGAGSVGPFKLTSGSIGQAPQTDPITRIDKRSFQLTRKMSVAGLSSGAATPRVKRSRTVDVAPPKQPAYSSDDEDEEEESEVRGTWERSGKLRPQFGQAALSD